MSICPDLFLALASLFLGLHSQRLSVPQGTEGMAGPHAMALIHWVQLHVTPNLLQGTCALTRVRQVVMLRLIT